MKGAALKTNEKGFSAVEGIIIVVLVAMLGVVGFMVYTHRNTSQTSNTKTTPTAEQTETPTESYKVPQGYNTYENKQIGFKFYYPQSWGKLETKSDPKLLFSAEVPDTDTTNSNDTLRLFANKTASFSLDAAYHAATVKPVKSGQDYVWQVVTPNTESATFKPGDIYNPAPKVVFEKDGLKVYEFPNAHANAIWTTFVFAVDDTFVAIVAPVSAPSMDLPKAQYDAEIAAHKATFAEVAKSIRIL